MLVSVESVISERDFGTIFSAVPVDGGSSKFRVRASTKIMLGRPAIGETWHVDGVIINTAFGPQMNAVAAHRTLPNGDGIRRYIAAHVPGIGEERAQRLWDRFGILLADVLSDESNLHIIAETLVPERPNLSLKLAAAVVRSWKATAAESNLVDWLMFQGIVDYNLARRISKIMGETAIARLESNPWTLTPLLPWAKVDALGLRILLQAKVPKHRSDLRRLVGAVDAVVKLSLEKGDTASDVTWLRSQLGQLLNVAESSPLVIDAIAAGERNGAFLPMGDGKWRAPGAALMEEFVLQALSAMLEPSYPCPLKLPSDVFASRLVDTFIDAERPLHQEQKAAVLQILKRPFTCLQGGAGVGKTYTMRVTCDVFEAIGGHLVLCALAGKAALRLSRSTGRPALTLARLLGELTERDRIQQELLEDGANEALERRLSRLIYIDDRTLVIIDEASMVDLPTYYAVLRRMPKGARLLLTGDDAQLPPIGFGLVYHLLVKDSYITAHLTVVHRQSAATGIPAVSESIRNNRRPELNPFKGKGEGVSFIEARHETLPQVLERVVDELGGHQAGVLVVTPTNEGLAGVRTLNRQLHDAYRRVNLHPEIKGYGANYYSVGEPVMFTRNDYSRNLFNGLLGQITSVDVKGRSLQVLFDGEDEPQSLGPEDLLDLTLAHAITCHRAQGSQAPRVVIPIFETRLLTPSWLYTAVTRAELQVVLIGQRDALGEGLNRPWTLDIRTVGFRWHSNSFVQCN